MAYASNMLLKNILKRRSFLIIKKKTNVLETIESYTQLKVPISDNCPASPQ